MARFRGRWTYIAALECCRRELQTCWFTQIREELLALEQSCDPMGEKAAIPINI